MRSVAVPSAGASLKFSSDAPPGAGMAEALVQALMPHVWLLDCDGNVLALPWVSHRCAACIFVTDLEVARPLDLRQLAEKRDVGRRHFAEMLNITGNFYNFYNSILVCKLENPDDLVAFPQKIEKLLHSLTDRVKTLIC